LLDVDVDVPKQFCGLTDWTWCAAIPPRSASPVRSGAGTAFTLDVALLNKVLISVLCATGAASAVAAGLGGRLLQAIQAWRRRLRLRRSSVRLGLSQQVAPWRRSSGAATVSSLTGGGRAIAVKNRDDCIYFYVSPS